MKNKRKQISNEISIRILSVVITIFVIFSIVVAIMIATTIEKMTQLPWNRWLSIPIYGKS